MRQQNIVHTFLGLWGLQKVVQYFLLKFLTILTRAKPLSKSQSRSFTLQTYSASVNTTFQLGRPALNLFKCRSVLVEAALKDLIDFLDSDPSDGINFSVSTAICSLYNAQSNNRVKELAQAGQFEAISQELQHRDKQTKQFAEWTSKWFNGRALDCYTQEEMLFKMLRAIPQEFFEALPKSVFATLKMGCMSMVFSRGQCIEVPKSHPNEFYLQSAREMNKRTTYHGCNAIVMSNYWNSYAHELLQYNVKDRQMGMKLLKEKFD